MAKRTRRRTRSRNRRHQSNQFDPQQSYAITDALLNGSSQFQPLRPQSAGHWQSQWDAWQTRRLSASATTFISHGVNNSISSTASSVWIIPQSRPSSSSSSQSYLPTKMPTAEVSVVEHRLRIFGGEIDDGLALCEPMMGVVRRLFDGKLDYLDP